MVPPFCAIWHLMTVLPSTGNTGVPKSAAVHCRNPVPVYDVVEAVLPPGIEDVYFTGAVNTEPFGLY